MDHLDKLIPLAILGALGVLLVVLLRRSARAERTLPVEPVAASLPVPAVEPTAVELLQVVVTQAPKKRKRAAIMPTTANAPKSTTIHKVLGMLKDKDTLAAAFLLREILDRPVSRRQ